MPPADHLAIKRRQRAAALLREFKGEDYVFGLDCLGRVGELAAATGGRRVAVVAGGVGKPWGEPLHRALRAALQAAGTALAGEIIAGAAPNSPREDVFRVAEALREQSPDVVVAAGGGSVIDAAKASLCWLALGDLHPDFDAYLGMDTIAPRLAAAGRALLPLVAVQTASGSAAHLTKYSNITDLATGQKLLIIDPAVVPPKALYDYRMSVGMGRDFTLDGALDGVSHCLEVYLGAPVPLLPRVEERCLLGMVLILGQLAAACADPGDLAAREALGLGTDLGGNAIMVGGTNGAHLNSFSLVDLLPHGRACALMNPYYVVFFATAPGMADRLRQVGAIYRERGHGPPHLDRLSGRDLGLAVAEAMLAFAASLGFPTRLSDVPGFTPAHRQRILAAARNPKLESKLRNMPVPLVASQVDDYMGPILDAAAVGDPGLVRSMP